jgi:hypothetical protein
MNWLLFSGVGVIILAIIIYVIFRNFKDEKELEEIVNAVDTKPGSIGKDVDLDEA